MRRILLATACIMSLGYGFGHISPIHYAHATDNDWTTGDDSANTQAKAAKHDDDDWFSDDDDDEKAHQDDRISDDDPLPSQQHNQAPTHTAAPTSAVPAPVSGYSCSETGHHNCIHICDKPNSRGQKNCSRRSIHPVHHTPTCHGTHNHHCRHISGHNL